LSKEREQNGSETPFYSVKRLSKL